MNQESRRIYLIKRLLEEDTYNKNMVIPKNTDEQKHLLRSLFNVRTPKEIDDEFIKVQDEYLKQEAVDKGIVDLEELKPIVGDIYLWRGDITRLKVDAIVNAANSALLGCFYPGHHCIDNAIHTFSGIQLRLACDEIVKKQGHGEDTGQAKITSGYNLPSKYVIHTVGPIIFGSLTQKDKDLLKSCYESCLKLAVENEVKSIAFCCISTGEFHFPNDIAAQIAIDMVKKFKYENNSNIKVIFNVFKEKDEEIYRSLLF